MSDLFHPSHAYRFITEPEEVQYEPPKVDMAKAYCNSLEKAIRIFCIESGLIEDAFSVTDDEYCCYTLYNKYPSGASCLKNYEMAFELLATSPLSKHTIRQAHQCLMQSHLDKSVCGVWKQRDNHVITRDGGVHYFCPHEHVESEMDRLIEIWNNLQGHFAWRAAWLHYHFISIHPFVDGNGRIARILANIPFMNELGMPTCVRLSNRDKYFGILQSIDTDQLADVTPLADFLVSLT